MKTEAASASGSSASEEEAAAIKEEPDWTEPYRSPSLSPDRNSRETARRLLSEQWLGVSEENINTLVRAKRGGEGVTARSEASVSGDRSNIRLRG